MTGTPSSVHSPSVPLPPPDFSSRSIPVHELNLALADVMRIHRSVYSPIFYNRRSASKTIFRFDAPGDEYGVLYAAESFSACMAETVIRDKFVGQPLPVVLTEPELSERSISLLGQDTPRLLRLADFTRPLFALGFTAQVVSDPDYFASNRWSKAVYDHPGNFDGIYFTSRYANQPSIALFDRSPVVPRGPAVSLLSSPYLGPFLDQYDIVLTP
jgi:hypothetical protein